MRRPSNTNLHMRNSSALLFGIAACLSGHGAHAATGPDAADPFKIFVADQYTYEDNLFRVPDGILAQDPSLTGVAKSWDDYVNRLSAGVQTRFDASKQVFLLDLRVDDVRYQENDYLDHRGGTGDLRWNFDIGKRWAGLLEARYDRGQAGYSNYLLFIKDIVETQSYLGELRFKIGSRWALLGGGSYTETTHSAVERRTSDVESQTGRVGVEYTTPNQTLIALEYAYTDATFPTAEQLVGFDVGYEQTLPLVRLQYLYSEKTRITGRAGYLKRDYTNPSAGDFSGNVWSINAYWEPRAQFYFDLDVWHELKAYADAEADYFVSTGASLTPTWSPTPLMKFSLRLLREDQSYRASATSLPIAAESGREDDLTSAGLIWDYTPRDYLNFVLAYRWIERDSNREIRKNEAEIASLQVKVAF